MQVIVNGKEHPVRDGAPLAELVRELGLEGKPIAVELNRSVVPRGHFEKTALSEGDLLEIVSLVGGG